MACNKCGEACLCSYRDRLLEAAQKQGLSQDKVEGLIKESVDSFNSKGLLEALAPRWQKAPEGSKCPQCGKESLERSYFLLGGPWGGAVRCTECDYRDSVSSYLGKTMFKVEPL